MPSQVEIPEHVPSALVKNFNYLNSGGETDAYDHFKKLHEGPDLFFTPCHGGHWVATRYEDMHYLLENRNQEFSSFYSSIPKHPFRFPLVEMDGPMHHDLRKTLAPFLTPKAVGNLQEKARTLTHELIDGFIEKGECDFIQDFAQKMPIVILMKLLDLPAEDTPYLLDLSELIVRGGDDPERQQAAYGSLANYIGERVIPARRNKPAEDVFSAFLQTQIGDARHLTDEELMQLGCLLIAAGLDTVASMLGVIVRFLAENPHHRQQLIDNEDLIPAALEELMRRHHIANIARTVARDIEYKGVFFKAGDMILIPTPAAGIDERRFDDPFRVDFGRQNVRTLVFGRGPHQCIGAFLARTELRVFMIEWLKRIPHFHIQAGTTPGFCLGKVLAITDLRLTWPTAR